nr:MAG TPA: hypothetical protein [Caudoviricetes sp.]
MIKFNFITVKTYMFFCKLETLSIYCNIKQFFVFI